MFSLLIAALIATAPQAPAAAGAAPAADPMDKVVCKSTVRAGSRLATDRVCMTKRQWAEKRQVEQSELNRNRSRSGSCNQPVC
jgi:Flp pilus assembly protein CpaB